MNQTYLLGHSRAELTRLELQAAFYERQTRLWLSEIGLRRGQRVLDFGCGVGDVAFLVAALVGEGGHVIGIDRSETAVQTAKARAQQLGLTQVEFHCADETQLPSLLQAESLDAVVGRLVLCHLPDPLDTLRQLAGYLRPGGVAAFQEPQLAAGWYGAWPPSPLLNQIWSWGSALCERAGLRVNMGMELRRLLLDAGFAEPTLLLTGRVDGGPDSPVFEYFAESMRSLLPALMKLGLATLEEVGIDTLAERLRAELTASGGAVVPAMVISGHARLIDRGGSR